MSEQLGIPGIIPAYSYLGVRAPPPAAELWEYRAYYAALEHGAFRWGVRVYAQQPYLPGMAPWERLAPRWHVPSLRELIDAKLAEYGA